MKNLELSTAEWVAVRMTLEKAFNDAQKDDMVVAKMLKKQGWPAPKNMITELIGQAVYKMDGEDRSPEPTKDESLDRIFERLEDMGYILE